MSRVHFLNVGLGDCIILEHASGRVTMFDICNGNQPRSDIFEQLVRDVLRQGVRGNFRMCDHGTNPLDFLRRIGATSIFRFVLSHPDCDHIDGLDALCREFTLSNYWDSGVRRTKPDFAGSPFREEDWDRHEALRDGTGVTSLVKRAGARFQYANEGDDHDGLYILAPDDGLVEAAHATGDLNDASYVLLYRSVGGRVLIPGDAHDKTWAFVLETSADDVDGVPLLIAPHHGRKSGRDYSFLDDVRPQLTLFGCAPSDALAYDAWNRRGLPFVTNNQAGNVTVECSDGQMHVFVENQRFAEACTGSEQTSTNALGYHHIGTIAEDNS